MIFVNHTYVESIEQTSGAADEVVNSATKRMPWSKSMGLKADAQKPVGDAKSYNEAAAAVNVDAPDTKRMPWSKPPELKGSGPSKFKSPRFNGHKPVPSAMMRDPHTDGL